MEIVNELENVITSAGSGELVDSASKAAEADPSTATVVLLGLGIVFIGLIIIIGVCKLMGLIMTSVKKPEEAVTPAPTPAAAPIASAPIADKGEVVAAISCAVAESLGKDVKAIRITSIKEV